VNLGQIHIQNRRYAQAIALLEPAFDDEPYSVTAAYNLGMALLRSRQQERGQQLIERSQALRATGYGTTFSNAYLERGKYAEALASTGAERELVDRTPPRVTFNRTTALPSPSTSSDATSPFGRQFQESDLTPEGARRLAASLGGALTMIDVDGDGDLDVVVATAGSERLFRNDAGRFVEATPGSGLGVPPADSVPVGGVAGDIDNDGIPDLFMLRYGRSSLYKNDGKGHFTDITASSGIRLTGFLPPQRSSMSITTAISIWWWPDWRTSIRRAHEQPVDRSRSPTNSRQRRSSYSETTATGRLPTSAARPRSRSAVMPWRSCRQTSTTIGMSISSSSATMDRRSC
jgi:hypothetical protein